jgi:hypothetical protein
MVNQDYIDNTRKDPKDWKTGDEPMTGAQQSYIETLSGGKQKAKDLSKAEASKMIDKLQDKRDLK